jgi:lipopolysaccharide/colanic/teichoic acid biosynthesis glycosyltransferase
LSKHSGLSVVEVRPARFQPTQDFVKHALDCALALIVLALSWPALLAIGVIIKLTSSGPVLEKPIRVGKGGRHFTCLKFRTTYRKDDPALLRNNSQQPEMFDQAAYITPVGRFLRRYTLDELPQLINILLGRMSFVGPRPLPAQDFGPDGMSREFFDWSEARARVRPGLTGLWQIKGRRNLTFDEMIGLDIEYIQTRSLWRDLCILVKTPAPVLRGVGAR